MPGIFNIFSADSDSLVLTMLIFLGIVTYVPELSLWLPRVLGML